MKIRKKAEFESVFARIQGEIERKICKDEENERKKYAEKCEKIRLFHDVELAKLQAKIATHKSLNRPVKVGKKCDLERKMTPEVGKMRKEMINLSDLRRHEEEYLRQKREKDAKRELIITENTAKMQDLAPPRTPEDQKRVKTVRLLQEKRQKYGLIVREMFCPPVNYRYKAERELLIAEMSSPKRREGKGGEGKQCQ